jgi:hypothetical protein
MTATTTAIDLNEHPMHDGVTWVATGPRGRLWVIAWQPARAENNIRAWPAPAGKTAHRGHATNLDTARARAREIADLIKTGRKA